MQEPLIEQPWMRQHLSSQSCFCFRSASKTAVPSAFPCQCKSASNDDAEIRFMRELTIRQFNRGRELRNFFPWTTQVLCQEAHCKHRGGNGPEFSARRGGKWERNTNKLELRTVSEASKWRLRSTHNIYSRGL